MVENILIIEDDKRIQEELVEYFSKPWKAIGVSNGIEAFKILK